MSQVYRRQTKQPPPPNSNERAMEEKKKPLPPMVHLNGTGIAELLDVREKAYYALHAAYDAIKAIAPNGRDYYPYGPGALEEAQEANMARMKAVQSVIDDIAEEMVAIADQP